MGKDIESAVKTGVFSLLREHDFLGELKLDYSNTYIDLTPLPNKKKQVLFSTSSPKQIQGILSDQSKITLVDCILMQSGLDKTKIQPHYVVFGEKAFDSEIDKVKSISFVIDAADTVFRDINAFGVALKPEDVLQEIINSNKKEMNSYNYNFPRVPIGARPQVHFFAGEHTIFVCEDTCFGKIKASHNIESSLLGSTKGVYLKNKILLEFEFIQPLSFLDSINRLSILLSFFNLMVGCEPNLLEFSFATDEMQADMNNNLFDVFWCNYPKSRDSKDYKETLIDAVESSEEFSIVLRNWLLRNNTRHDSRFRFYSNFNKQIFDIDRLISAANIFDILPNEDVPKGKEIPENLKIAIKDTKEIFKGLPDSNEKDSI